MKSGLNPESEYTSLETAAAYYDLSQRTVRRMIEDGRLPAVKIGRQIRIRITDLDALAEPIATTGGAA